MPGPILAAIGHPIGGDDPTAIFYQQYDDCIAVTIDHYPGWLGSARPHAGLESMSGSTAEGRDTRQKDFAYFGCAALPFALRHVVVSDGHFVDTP